MRRSLLSIILVALLILPIQGCNYNTAQGVYTGVTIALNLAQGELPLLVSTGAISQADETALSNYLALATTFNNNYEACITNAQNATLTTSGKFVDCLGVFANSLSSPATLATLHLISTKAQSKAQAYIAAIVAAVNIGLAAFKAGQVATPTVAPVTADTIKDTNEFKDNVIAHLPLELRIANGL